ncbi:MAG TPA: NUDIX domain-containing protein [Xanthobacteraceae bacterium]|nr:NUDIX domain-containing protein [Xanthobacteraceae bacterium]
MKRSAGILVYRAADSGWQVLLAHPGGPFWRRKDLGAWSIPKGEIDPDEDALAAAVREFSEETGIALAGDFLPLGELRQAGGKQVLAWALCANIHIGAIRSNTFALQWPPKSGRIEEFPEIDRVEWFDFPAAREKILFAQRPFLDRLAQHLDRHETE